MKRRWLVAGMWAQFGNETRENLSALHTVIVKVAANTGSTGGNFGLDLSRGRSNSLEKNEGS